MAIRSARAHRAEALPKHVWVDGDLLASDRVPGLLLDLRVVDGGKWECYRENAHHGAS